MLSRFSCYCRFLLLRTFLFVVTACVFFFRSCHVIIHVLKIYCSSSSSGILFVAIVVAFSLIVIQCIFPVFVADSRCRSSLRKYWYLCNYLLSCVVYKSCGFVEICDVVYVCVYAWNNCAVEM